MKRVLELLWMTFNRHFVKLPLQLEPLLITLINSGMTLVCGSRILFFFNITLLIFFLIFFSYRVHDFWSCGYRHNQVHQWGTQLVQWVRSNQGKPLVTCRLHMLARQERTRQQMYSTWDWVTLMWYMVMFINDLSTHLWVFFMKEKSEISSKANWKSAPSLHCLTCFLCHAKSLFKYIYI